MFLLGSTLDAAGEGDGDQERRRAYLAQLRRILPASPAWEAWLERTGALPPDFECLPSSPDLPDPLLRRVNGRPVKVTNRQEWEARRAELKALFQQWVLGRVPPPPDGLRATVLREREESGARVREVGLTFGPGEKARLSLELLIPKGKGPFPVFLTQHNHRDWALIALRRGYLGCVYAGADSRDDTDSFVEAYPDCDWSRLTRRAWAASRCIDYLATVPEANTKQVALTGHSRNGKQSLIASALDERIAVVLSSSSGAGGAMTTRHFADQHFAEGIESLTRVFPDWFHPRLRFFVGREDRLPVDLHELVALSAPRPCLLSIALNDPVESTWAMQQTYRAVQSVYRLLGAEERLRILWRPGSHETWPAIIERYLDWCDTQFGRGRYAFPERLIHPSDWNAWKAHSREQVDLSAFPSRGLGDLLVGRDGGEIRTPAEWEARRAELRAQAQWMLGEAPPGVADTGSAYGKEAAHIAALLGRPSAGEGLEKEQVVFGDYLPADVYLPAGLRQSGRKAPAVLWLHPFSFSNGYVAGYRRGEQVFRTLAKQGFVVFCYDQVGHGRRIEEVEGFYVRYPRWSLLGQMVRDAQAALDAILALPYVNQERVWGLGYGLGSLVGLHLAALDDRPAGFALVCAPPPFRLDSEQKGGGIRRWSRLHMLLPRLGFFEGEEERIPYDLPHLMACFAPRPLLVISPQLDREAPLADVTRGVEAARQVYALYGASERLKQDSPEDFNHFDERMQRRAVEWLRDLNRDA